MIASVQAGAISKNASHPGFHWPALSSCRRPASPPPGRGLHAGRLRFFQQDGGAQAAGMERQKGRDLQDRQDLLAAGARFERAAHMPAGASGLKFVQAAFTARLISSTFAWEHAAGPRIAGHLEALLDPLRSHSRNFASAGCPTGRWKSRLSRLRRPAPRPWPRASPNGNHAEQRSAVRRECRRFIRECVSRSLLVAPHRSLAHSF